jgi:hypothetical protein
MEIRLAPKAALKLQGFDSQLMYWTVFGMFKIDLTTFVGSEMF